MGWHRPMARQNVNSMNLLKTCIRVSDYIGANLLHFFIHPYAETPFS